MTNNKIIFINEKTAQVTKAFMKNAMIFGTDEFKLWREYKAMFPKAQMTTKTIKKNPNKLNDTKNKTYENMAAYIRTQENAAELMREFEVVCKQSKIQSNPYRSVLAWFEKKFEGYDGYKKYFEELAEKKAEQESLFSVEKTA